ncbi:hypothetical protein QYF61_010369 [Mycteria americana]|uniref:Uncharacterized protein n=1 Tax=Mycteria americana TaxID=33587 RepID=A0AAN7NAC6_MYCAM|nr:hypothetical protein QYF61_010369 [Mycteria americana]
MAFPARAQKGVTRLNGTFKYQAMGQRMYWYDISPSPRNLFISGSGYNHPTSPLPSLPPPSAKERRKENMETTLPDIKSVQNNLHKEPTPESPTHARRPRSEQGLLPEQLLGARASPFIPTPAKCGTHRYRAGPTATVRRPERAPAPRSGTSSSRLSPRHGES